MSYKAAPSHLSTEAKKWWRIVFRTYEMDEEGAFILRQALDCYDRVLQAQAQIKQDGIVIDGRFGKRAHPALEIERAARSGLLQSWRMLRIDLEPPKAVGRPPGPRGVK
jgi:phage terminase small subunit